MVRLSSEVFIWWPLVAVVAPPVVFLDLFLLAPTDSYTDACNSSLSLTVFLYFLSNPLFSFSYFCKWFSIVPINPAVSQWVPMFKCQSMVEPLFGG